MRAVLGIDGGGHKTHAVLLGERGEFLGFGAAGSGNHQVHGLQAALGEIGKAAGEALRAARVDPGEVAVGCYCLSGADLPEDYAMLQEAVGSLAFPGSPGSRTTPWPRCGPGPAAPGAL